MTENLKKFYYAISEDPEMEQDFKQLLEGGDDNQTEKIITFAKVHGIELSPEDFEILETEEIEDGELATISGGFQFDCTQNYMDPYPNNGYNPVRKPL